MAYADQVVLLRGWRQAVMPQGSSWWAQITRLTVNESAASRRAVLTDRQVAAAEITPLPGQDYAHVPRAHDARQ
ncbi:hypothetical protein GCM10010156_65880 [Planobispora rosea]|uniref:Uncharacterized protein n=1 Tax=Planobispora rosea TaxID=35762 RepID=A0A8J3S4Y1_PLARO|nr:hypothetical protein GCM10010156_65880 [Planobispora rosea]GIH87952.1 hypothetical protein Pro02_63600 [Planobispora rosea]